MEISAAQLSALLEGAVEGDPNVKVNAPGGIEQAKPNQISFLGNLKYESHLYSTQAGIVIIPKNLTLKKEVQSTLIRVADVYVALAQLFQAFVPDQAVVPGVAESAEIAPGAMVSMTARVEPGAFIDEGAIVGDGVLVGPQVYIGKNAVVGERSILHSGVKLYKDCRIGRRCILHSNAVIGADGFGFAKQADGFLKIPHLGKVVVGDDVEIGANTAIDRGSMGDTIIGNGVKIDNLVHIAHNVQIGDRTAIAAQTGIAGSTVIGKDCLFGGQVGVVGHLKIADGTQVQAQSGIGSNVKEKGSKLFGYPAFEYGKYVKAYTIFKRLPEIWNRLRAIEKKIGI